MHSNFNLSDKLYCSSFLSDFMGCPRYAENRWIKGWVPKTTKPSLLFGEVFHGALKVWYETGDKEKALEEFNKLPITISDDHRTPDFGRAIFKQYVAKYKQEPWKSLYLETEFRVDIQETDILYGGTIDQIVEWNNQIYVVDHKTTRSLGLSFFDGYRPHPQTDGYCMACREICGKCAGVIVNGISVAKQPKERFQRFTSGRSDYELDEFRRTFISHVDEFERCLEKKEFPKRTTYCNRWGKCMYWDVCVYGSDPEYVKKLVEMKFDVEDMTQGDGDGQVTNENHNGMA